MVFGRVIVTFTCAIFGAAFGYILGLFLGLIPGLAIMGGMSMPALLAALGFMGGLLLGILASLTMTFVRHDLYVGTWHGRARRIRRSFRHGDAYAMRRRHRFDDHGAWYGSDSCPVEDTLLEIDGYLSYLEDLPKDQLALYDDRMGRLGDRLSDLRASLQR